jgi:hypothetical protein
MADAILTEPVLGIPAEAFRSFWAARAARRPLAPAVGMAAY